jgi:uncharacterized membrane protein
MRHPTAHVQPRKNAERYGLQGLIIILLCPAAQADAWPGTHGVVLGSRARPQDGDAVAIHHAAAGNSQSELAAVT